MVFHITFMLALLHDKKCYNCINFFFSYILWDFIVMGLVLSWWKFDQDNWRSHEEHMLKAEKSVSFATHLATRPTREMTHEMH